MARVVSKTKSKSTPDGAAKRPMGRPAGSKNKVKAAPVVKAATKKVASATAKFSKADLEAQVAKLERALARSRKQVAELKLLASGSPGGSEQAVSQPNVSPPAKKSTSPAAKAPKQKPVAARGRRKKSDDVAPALDETSGEAETEAHAS